MENLTLELLLLAFLGMTIHILMKTVARTDKSNKLSVRYWLKDRFNIIRLILSILSTIALLIMANDLTNILGVELSDGSSAEKLFAFVAGYLNHSFIRNILKVFKKNHLGESTDKDNVA